MSARDTGTAGISEKYWRVEKAKRVAFLVDSASYFEAIYEAFRRAKRSILVVGWELDPSVRLFHDREPRELPGELGPLLGALLEREEELEVRLLPWDYSSLGLREKVLAPAIRWKWPHHERLFFHPDASHAPAAAHHQKIVVIDDALAFCGGMDLTWRRWDTPEHRVDDPRRRDHQGNAYGPWHDVQMAVDADAAAALGDLARERWRRATGETLSPVAASNADPWPEELEVELRNAPVGISRTEAGFASHPETHEIERAYLDALQAARRFIYVENQYLTSFAVGEVLSGRLREPDGPEVVIVVPEEAEGWLEEGLMSALRVRLLNRLEQADRYNRLRVYRPVVPNLGEGHVDLHSKTLIVDGKLVTVGSANVSNRSMTLDTECNLTVEAGRSRQRAEGIRRFLFRLLAEHLDSSVAEVERFLEKSQSLIATVDGLSRTDRNLAPLSNEYPEWVRKIAPSSSLSDPEGPMDVSELTEAVIPRRVEDLTNHPMLKLAAGLTALSVVALGWLWSRAPR